jgi:tetratricopeptide (TPR) repeat protein
MVSAGGREVVRPCRQGSPARRVAAAVVGRLAALLAFALIAQLSAQSPDERAAGAEVEVVAALLDHADALDACKQYGSARELRLQVVEKWQPGNGRALEGLGFVKVGEKYRRDMAKVVFEQNVHFAKKELKKLDRDWDRVLRGLVKSIQSVAEAYAEAGQPAAASEWWSRLLLLRPDDRKAKSAIEGLAVKSFDSFEGTERQLKLLRRGRRIHQSVAYLLQREFPTTAIDGRQPLLEKAGIAHHGVASRHFRVWGSLPTGHLQQAAQHAERALALAQTLFDGSGGACFAPGDFRDMLWVADRGHYHRVLDACSDQFSAERLAFLKDDVELAFVSSGSDVLRLYVLDGEGVDVLLDQTVRGVVQDALGFKVHGLWEGIGHAACGLLFDRTLTFFIEQQAGDTVTNYTPRPLVPDMSVWREIATESAWGRNDTPTSRLVLLHGSKFSNEERVKAWAMVDFLFRHDPSLVSLLEELPGSGRGDPPSIEAEYERRTGERLIDLDAEWRRYWGQDKRLREAMAAPAEGVEKAVAEAQRLAWQINDARVDAGRGAVGFRLVDDEDSRSVHDWFAAVERHEREQQKPRAKPADPPSPPACFGRTVLGVPPGKGVGLVSEWIVDPMLRDLILHPGRDFVGIRIGSKWKTISLTDPLREIRRGAPFCWPADGQSIQGMVTVVQLGAGLRQAMAAAGRTGDDPVGMPLTLHFSRDVGRNVTSRIGCHVQSQSGQVLRGVLVEVESSEGGAGIGCMAFVPTEPLPAGELQVQWSLPRQVLGDGETFPPQRVVVQ